MKLRFVKFDPSGNTTILVLSPVPRAEQPAAAARLMAENCLCAEQVGFVERANLPGARARLQMMGGEFCGNASMSLAALLAREDGLAEGANAEYPLEVSGAEGLVRCQVLREGEYSFHGSASMPLPTEFGTVEIPGSRTEPVVLFPGIGHIISMSPCAISKDQAEKAAPELCEKLGLDALGILLLSSDASAMRPLVYVRSTGSKVWERGCGSGTAAVVAHRAMRDGRDASLAIRQPGGTIVGRAKYGGGKLTSLEIAGAVRLVAGGEVYV